MYRDLQRASSQPLFSLCADGESPQHGMFFLFVGFSSITKLWLIVYVFGNKGRSKDTTTTKKIKYIFNK